MSYRCGENATGSGSTRRRRGGFHAMSRCKAVALSVVVGLSVQADRLSAQGVQGEVAVSAAYLDLQPLVRDSLPEDEVPGTGIRRRLPDGTLVTCTPEEFCRWYRSGEAEGITLVTQDLRVAAWTGIRGLSAHVQVRGRYGTDDIWPRGTQKFDGLSAYLSYDRAKFRVKGGRVFLTNGLGYYNFDGVSFLWRGFAPLRIEAWGGWSLARNTDQPRDGSLMEDADVFAPDDRANILGVEVGAFLGRKLSGSVLYQREIRTDRLALYTERVAADINALLGRFTIDASAKYDVAYGDFNLAQLTVSAPIGGGFQLSAQGRHYLPFFELWTIWGAFSPVGFNEARGYVTWTSPGLGLQLQGGGGYRAYEDTQAGADFVGIKDYGWTVYGRASWSRDGWFADGGYRAETGFGAVRYGGDAAFGRTFAPGTYVGLRGTSTQTFGEFRLGNQFLNGGGIDGALALGDFSLNASVAAYQIDEREQPAESDWTQLRASAGIAWRFGTEPRARSRASGAAQ